jgi:glycosyltransferase involved in cell wall biosynthesis
MVSQNIKILLVYNHKSRWIKDDITILNKHFDLETFYYKKDKKKKKLSFLIKNSDIIFIWFPSYHGLNATRLARKYNKKLITVASGYSVANIPQFNYGLAANFHTRWIPKYILKNCSAIVAVSESNKKEISRLIGYDNNITVIPHGFNIEKFKSHGKIMKEKKVITVGNFDKTSWKRKGIDNFLSVARKIPDIPFIVIGKIKDDIKNETQKASSNVIFTRFVSDEELIEFYRKAKIYAQFSFHEAFGCSVAEAMLFQCIPVVTEIGSLPEVVGDSGFYIPYWNQDVAVKTIYNALKAPENFGMKAENRIEKNFSMGKREKKLKKLIENI